MCGMRKKRQYKRDFVPDAEYGRVDFSRFINHLMKHGKKSVAESVFYSSLRNIKGVSGEEPEKVFEKAIENVSPVFEVRSKRVGGANYQIPVEVRPERKFFLACKWIIGAAAKKKGGTMAKKLTEEFLAAARNEGAAIKKKQDTHRMAEANRAFASFAR